MSRPSNEKTPAGMNYSEGLPNQTESEIQTEPASIVDQLVSPDKYKKDVATAVAQCALLGCEMYAMAGGGFKLVAGGLTRYCGDLGQVISLLKGRHE
jgi:hypothetical protein